MDPKTDSTLGTIIHLAVELAQRCPDGADTAARIADLASSLRGGEVGQGTLRDAIDSSTVDSDISSAQVDATVGAVAKMNRDPDDLNDPDDLD